MYSMSSNKPRLNASGLVSSSQERIVDHSAGEEMGVTSVVGTVDDDVEKGIERVKDGAISKTVEFQFHATTA
jgi:hypothetical protein